VELSDVEAVCPACSGRGFSVLPMTEGHVPCSLCEGVGFLDDEVKRKRVWECLRTKSVAWCAHVERDLLGGEAA
jgi:RecJ-like exonuclease